MGEFIKTKNSIIYERDGETVRISACGKNAVRFEGFPGGEIFEENFTLMPGEGECSFEERDYCIFMTNGEIKIQLERSGKVTVYRSGRVILEEKPELTFESGYRHYEKNERGTYSARITFRANEGEHLYGLGHEASGRFDLKGCSFDLRHVNAKCTIPYIYSSLGYGFLWNNPAVGSVELSYNRTRWSVSSTKKIDWFYNVASEDLDIYLGVYVSKKIGLDFIVTKEGNTLIGQIGDDAFSFEAVDKDKFKCDQLGAKFEFNPKKNTMTLFQNGAKLVLRKKE